MNVIVIFYLLLYYFIFIYCNLENIISINIKKIFFFLMQYLAHNFNTITDRKNRLDPETVQATICLKRWIDNQFCQKNIDVEMKKF